MQRTEAPDDLEIMGGPFDVMRTAEGECHVGGGLTFKRYRPIDGPPPQNQEEDWTGRVILRLWRKEQDGWHFRSVLARPLTREEWSSMVRVIGA